MQSLKAALQEQDKLSSQEIWEILKNSEEDLKKNLAEIQSGKVRKLEWFQEQLRRIADKRDELQQLRNDVESIRQAYFDYNEAVRKQFEEHGLNFKQIVNVAEKVVEDALNEQKLNIINLLEQPTTDISNMRTVVNKVVDLLQSNKSSNLHEKLNEEIIAFNKKSLEFVRIELWNHLRKFNVPLKDLERNHTNDEKADFYEQLDVFCSICCQLEYLANRNYLNCFDQFVAILFHHLRNICSELIERDKNRGDFEWILDCSYKWSQNMQSIAVSCLDRQKMNYKSVDRKDLVEIVRKKCVETIQAVITKFLKKNISDHSIFSKITSILRNFETLTGLQMNEDESLFEPLYSSEVLSKWILLEVELFTVETDRLLDDEKCFEIVDSCRLSENMKWASKMTLFVDGWLNRIDQDVRLMTNSETQSAFYETCSILLSELCDKINKKINQLYMEPTWANNVYLVINNVWELRGIIENAMLTWPVSSYDIEKQYESEWNRLVEMIVEYLDDIVDSMDTVIRANYSTEEDKIRKINRTIERIVKCLTNVVTKVSGARNELLNRLLAAVLRIFQKRFDGWTNSSENVVESIYGNIYIQLIGYLNSLESNKIFEKSNDMRTELTQLDSMMKLVASNTSSEKLIGMAFKSIDEEQVIKMLGEMGIPANSDSPDYQILAEGYNKYRNVM